MMLEYVTDIVMLLCTFVICIRILCMIDINSIRSYGMICVYYKKKAGINKK